MSFISPTEVWFQVAQRVEKRKPHSPTRMLSLNSSGPFWTYACLLPYCDEHVTTLPEKEWPVCTGTSIRYSFTTLQAQDG